MVKVSTERWDEVWDAMCVPMGQLSQDLEYLEQMPSPTEKDCEVLIRLTGELSDIQRELHKKYKRYLDGCAKREEMLITRMMRHAR